MCRNKLVQNKIFTDMWVNIDKCFCEMLASEVKIICVEFPNFEPVTI